MKFHKVGSVLVTAIYTAGTSWNFSSAFNLGENHQLQSVAVGSISKSAKYQRERVWAKTNNHDVESETKSSTNTEESDNPLGLTSELKKLTAAFQNIGDDKLRYKQLLYMANQLQPLNKSLQIPENKVRGCLSTVYVDGTILPSDDDEIKIQFVGDSDGVLTKGLVAFLIRGLSGNTASKILKVNPQFIQQAGISTSLTPGRNNGFLNMLAAMKQKAVQLEEQELERRRRNPVSLVLPQSESNCNDSNSAEITNGGPIYNKIIVALQALQPATLKLEDVSYQHAGHAGAKDSGDESHFELYIVADAFDGLNLVKRHKLVYMMLGDIMPQIHALQIQAKTPSECTQQ
jgi:sulfur transfer protein SufE/stress-induced morphogen